MPLLVQPSEKNGLNCNAHIEKQAPQADNVPSALSFETKHEMMKLGKWGFNQASFSSPYTWLVC